MNVVKIKSYAKVNLTLEVVGERAGFHLLDSFVANVDLFNLVVVQKRKDKLVSGRMKGMGMDAIPFENTNANKVAEKFVEKFGVTGVDITVYENIPVGAGLGGSSADSAGVLRALCELYGVPLEETYPIANECGSDIRYMLEGGYARMQGKGESVTPLEDGSALHLLLLCPTSGVSTKECFQKYDELLASGASKRSDGKITQQAIELYQSGALNALCSTFFNDLFEPAKQLSKDVANAYEELTSFSPLGVGMTGAGSCVFAVFETKELCEWAKSRYRGKCRAIVTQTIAKKPKKVWKNPFSL